MRSARVVGLAALLTTSAAMMLAGATASADVQLISRTPAGGYGDGASVTPSISANGARVAFQSDAKNLGPVTGAFSGPSVFVWDAPTSSVVLGGRTDTPGTNGLPSPPPDDVAQYPSISGDGSVVLFSSTATNIVTGVTDTKGQVFRTGLDFAVDTRLVSHAFNSADPPSEGAYAGAISGDGTEAVVLSSSRDMVPPTESNHLLGLFRVPVCCHLGQQQALINNLPGKPYWGDGESSYPTDIGLSDDGATIVFTSKTKDLLPVNSATVSNVYAWSSTGGLQLVSRASGAAGAPGDASSFNSAISADGRYVSFESAAFNLDPAVTKLYDDPDQNAVQEVYVRDLLNQTTTLVSRGGGADGPPAQGNGGADGPLPGFGTTSISGDGRYVAFQSNAPDLTNEDCGPPAPKFFDIFVRDRVANTTTLISRASRTDPTCGNPPDPRPAGVYGDSTFPRISRDGRKIAFVSDAANIGPVGNAARTQQLYLADTGVEPPAPTVGQVPAGPAPVAPTPAPLPPGTSAAKDKTAPKLSGLKLDPAVFAVRRAHSAAKARGRLHRGATIRFTTSEVAAVRFDVLTRPGAATRSVKRRKPAKRRARRLGSLKRTAQRGRNGVAFTGTVGGRALAPGRYTLKATATDAAGNRSRVATATFRILAGR